MNYYFISIFSISISIAIENYFYLPDHTLFTATLGFLNP